MRKGWCLMVSMILSAIFDIGAAIFFTIVCLVLKDWHLFGLSLLILVPYTLGVLFNLIGLLVRKRGWALASVCCYAFQGVVLPILLIPIIISSVLSFVYWSSNSPVVDKMNDDWRQYNKF